MRRARQLIAALAILAATGVARAGDKDADALVALAESLNTFVEGNNAEALKKLSDALKACSGIACDAGTRAQLLVAIGIVHGAGEKDLEKAKADFLNALREDPKVAPDRQFMTKDLTKVFADAKAEFKKTGGAPPPARPAPTKAMLDAVAAAEAQLKQKDWSSCMGTILAAMGESEFAAGKLVLATCEDAGGLLLEAANDAKAALKLAEDEQNAPVGQRATELAKRLETDTPSIVVVIPRAIDEPELKIDGVTIPADKADKPIPHNPGKATVEVKGKRGSFPFSFKTTESIDRGEKITVNVDEGKQNTSALQACLANARTARELNLCIETEGKGRGLTFRGGLEVATYVDSVNVDVFSPTAFVSAENPTSGWRLGATYTVDVVSNASPDIIATATRRFDEVRHAPSISGETKIGPARAALDGALSIEPDYVSRSIGAALSADVGANKTVTPVLAYHVAFDTLGRAHTPFDVFSRSITTHTIDLGASLITSPSTLVVLGVTGELVFGDTSKPYRHIPMFTADVAPRVPRGASPELLDRLRLAPAPFEQLPDQRSRLALLARVAHRFEQSTLRADERLYADSWGLKASTTDARFFYDLTKSLRVGPHVRFHVQGPVNFWKRAYVAQATSAGYSLPDYRAGDRELGPLFGVTLGAGGRLALSDVVAIQLQASGVYTQFLDHILVYDRWGFLTATTLEIGVE